MTTPSFIAPLEKDLPKFLIGDDTEAPDGSHLYVVHLHAPRFVARAEHSREFEQTVLHPLFLDADSVKLTAQERRALLDQAAAFYQRAWTDAVKTIAATSVPGAQKA